MKKILLLIALSLLTGCDKRKSIAAVISDATGGSASVAEPMTVLVMGQSNAVRLNPAGYRGWNEARGSADTFINCAENGTTMAQWDPSGSRFANCVAMTQGQTIDVILWYQGESDAHPGIGGSASDYAQKCVSLFAAFRAKWGNVPIVYAQIAVVDIVKLPAFVNWQQVKDQQASIYYPDTRMVRTDDITEGSPLAADGIHFDDAGDYQVGRRMAAALRDIQ